MGLAHIKPLNPTNFGAIVMGRTHHFNGVKSVGRVVVEQEVAAQPMGGATPHEAALLTVYGFNRTAMAFVLAGLDLYKEVGLAVEGDEIKFAMAAGAHILAEDAAPMKAQITRSPAFAPRAGGQVLRQLPPVKPMPKVEKERTQSVH